MSGYEAAWFTKSPPPPQARTCPRYQCLSLSMNHSVLYSDSVKTWNIVSFLMKQPHTQMSTIEW